jgi:hypothetical protein
MPELEEVLGFPERTGYGPGITPGPDELAGLHRDWHLELFYQDETGRINFARLIQKRENSPNTYITLPCGAIAGGGALLVPTGSCPAVLKHKTRVPKSWPNAKPCASASVDSTTPYPIRPAESTGQ